MSADKWESLAELLRASDSPADRAAPPVHYGATDGPGTDFACEGCIWRRRPVEPGHAGCAVSGGSRAGPGSGERDRSRRTLGASRRIVGSVWAWCPMSADKWESLAELLRASDSPADRAAPSVHYGATDGPGTDFSTEPQTGPRAGLPIHVGGPSWGPQTSWTLTDRAPSRGRSPVKRKRKHRRRHRSSSSRGSSSSRSGSGEGRKRHRHPRRRTALREGQAPMLSLLTAMKESLDALHAAPRDSEPREPDLPPSAQGPATSPIPASPTVGRDPELEPHEGGLSVPSGPGALRRLAEWCNLAEPFVRYEASDGSRVRQGSSYISGPGGPDSWTGFRVRAICLRVPIRGGECRLMAVRGPTRAPAGILTSRHKQVRRERTRFATSPSSSGLGGGVLRVTCLTDTEYVQPAGDCLNGVLGVVDAPPEAPASLCDWQRIGTSGTGALHGSPSTAPRRWRTA